MKRLLVLVCAVLILTASSAYPKPSHYINSKGVAIPSLFDGVVSSARQAAIYAQIFRAGPRRNKACLVKTVYRLNDRPFLVQADNCTGHYQVDYSRICSEYCGGGMEGWTYSDSENSDYCTGYAIDFTACNTGNCREEYTCYNNVGPTCF